MGNSHRASCPIKIYMMVSVDTMLTIVGPSRERLSGSGRSDHHTRVPTAQSADSWK